MILEVIEESKEYSENYHIGEVLGERIKYVINKAKNITNEN